MELFDLVGSSSYLEEGFLALSGGGAWLGKMLLSMRDKLAKVPELEARLVELDKLFEGHSKQDVIIDERLAHIDNRMDKMEGRFDRIDDKMDRLLERRHE